MLLCCVSADTHLAVHALEESLHLIPRSRCSESFGGRVVNSVILAGGHLLVKLINRFSGIFNVGFCRAAAKQGQKTHRCKKIRAHRALWYHGSVTRKTAAMFRFA